MPKQPPLKVPLFLRAPSKIVCKVTPAWGNITHPYKKHVESFKN